MKISKTSDQRRNLTGLRSEQGFTILELVISMMIFLIVTGAIWGLLRIAQTSRGNVNEQVQLTKSIRFALNIIGRDTYNAGFGYPGDTTVVLKDRAISNLLQIPIDNDNSRDTVPPIIAGNNITTNTFNTVTGVKTDQITMLFKDSTFNQIGVVGKEVSQPLIINAATTTSTGIDQIIPILGSNVSCRLNDVMLIAGNAGSTVGVVTGLEGTDKVNFANSDILNFNKTGASGFLRTIVTPASMFRVQVVTYFTTADGILTRREFGNSASLTSANYFVDQPLVYNVENFQIQYVLDDGTLSDNPAAGPDGILGNSDDSQAILERVRQVKFTISVRSVDLDPTGKPYKQTMSTTYSTRNLGYDAS